MSTRVVVADDQALVRGGFRMILDARDDIEVVGRGRRRRARQSSWSSACSPTSC